MSKVTIEDISRHTGLSRGTVSRALNDRPDISQATKNKVLEACRQLNYVPSHAARSLATGRAYAVAVLLHDLRAAFDADFLRGAIARAQSDHYAVIVLESAADREASLQHVAGLARERVDAVLVATPAISTLPAALTEAFARRPMVAAVTVSGVACDVMAPDMIESGRLVGRRLLRDGVSDVLYVHNPSATGAADRLAGFHEICRERHVDAGAVTLTVSGQQDPAWAGVAARLAGLRAVAGSDDYVALQLMLVARGAGRTPGRDLAVVGQGNEPVTQCIEPGLTSVDLAGEEIGRRAMDLALQRVNKARMDAPQSIYVAPTLIERGSTACP